MDVHCEVLATDIVKSDSVTFIDFLAEIDHNVDPSLGVHLVMGNGSSHTSKETRRWLEAHPRFVAHYTPRHASWVSMVELFFSIITRKVLETRQPLLPRRPGLQAHALRRRLQRDSQAVCLGLLRSAAEGGRMNTRCKNAQEH